MDPLELYFKEKVWFPPEDPEKMWLKLCGRKGRNVAVKKVVTCQPYTIACFWSAATIFLDDAEKLM